MNEDLHRLAFPRGGIDDRLAVPREERGANLTSRERDLLKGRRWHVGRLLARGEDERACDSSTEYRGEGEQQPRRTRTTGGERMHSGRHAGPRHAGERFEIKGDVASRLE